MNVDPRETYQNKTWMISKYSIERARISEIASCAGVQPGTIYKWLAIHGIEITGRGANISKNARGITRSDTAKKNMSESRKGILTGDINPAKNEFVRNIIREKKTGMPRQEFSDEWKSNIGTAHLGLKHTAETKRKLSAMRTGNKNPMYGRTGDACPSFKRVKSPNEIRKIIENRPDTTGANNPNWRGGKSFEPYCVKFNSDAKERIRNAFDRKCFICGKQEGKRKLSVHHVDYNKNTLCNGKEWGLIPLCQTCHLSTNYNRWHWFCALGNYWAIKYAECIQ